VHQCTLLLLGLLCAAGGQSGIATLTWDPNTETDLAGYKVYYGTASGTYTQTVDVGKVSTFTIAGLASAKWFFAVTAYNGGGLESGFSNEVSKTINNCDLNGDGSTDVLDIQVLVNAILGITPVVGGDLNGDSKIDVLDLQFLANVILGKTNCR